MYQPHLSIALLRYPIHPPLRISHRPASAPGVVTLFLLCAISFTTPVVGDEMIVNSLSEIESGTLLFPSANQNHYLRAPLTDTAVDIGVQGLFTRTVVNQRFTNESVEWTEAIYAFPLPDDATVDELTMIIGDKQINGVIQPKLKALQTYKTAKRQGQKATLLEQQRPNLFTSKIANIPPGETITVRIAYQSSARYSDGQFSLFFPLTITPRYSPGTALEYSSSGLEDSARIGWTTPEDIATAEKDRAAITPPMTKLAASTSISVTLETGLSGLDIKSSSHDIITTRGGSGTSEIWHVSLATNTIPTDRDFKLTWTPQTTQAPVAAVFRQDKNIANNAESFASVMVMPPQQLFANAIPPRDVIFVIDTSESMSGNSIRQARRTLALGIEQLVESDTFNVIEFDNNTNKLFSSSVLATTSNKKKAVHWVENLTADGGTEILGALVAALNNGAEQQRIRQIVFVTDGSVGNEDEIFRYLKQNIGAARLFTVGIGSAPNTWFMRKSAELGRGTYTTIANTNELLDKVLLLLTKLERPAITDISIAFSTNTPAEVFPTTIPDVYMGEPVLADARWSQLLTSGVVEVRGTYGGQLWSQKLNLGTDVSHVSNNTQGLDKRWASRKIQSLEDSLLLDANPKLVEQAITEIALNYSLVTRYTSLVAVEDKISRDTSTEPLQRVAVPQTMPAGNTMHFPQGSMGTTLRFIVSLILTLFVLLLVRSKLRRPDTSIVCLPVKSHPVACRRRVRPTLPCKHLN